jgi:hypothetical protein
VNAQLEKAFLQLAGGTGHTPRDGDVRVAEVHINSRDNPWPAPGGAYTRFREPISIHTLCKYATDEMIGLLKKSDPLVQWLAGQTYQQGQQLSRLGKLGKYTDTQGQTQVNPKSTRLIAVTPPTPFASGKVDKVRCVTVKIRYKPAYLISTSLSGFIDPSNIVEISELVLQAYQNSGIIVEVVKYKELHMNMSANTAWTEVKFS